jgi:hypothetical protein
MRLLLLFFLVYLLALTYPGMAPFNRIEPMIGGFPFSLVWVMLWVLLGWVALALRYRADRKGER